MHTNIIHFDCVHGGIFFPKKREKFLPKNSKTIFIAVNWKFSSLGVLYFQLLLKEKVCDKKEI
jgi:hypothetical protein